MKLSRKWWVSACMVFGAGATLAVAQYASALAGYGMLTRYYSNSSYQTQVGFTQDASKCLFGTKETFGTVTPYKKVNSFKCPDPE